MRWEKDPPGKVSKGPGERSSQGKPLQITHRKEEVQDGQLGYLGVISFFFSLVYKLLKESKEREEKVSE